jgi:hypothetical protein
MVFIEIIMFGAKVVILNDFDESFEIFRSCTFLPQYANRTVCIYAPRIPGNSMVYQGA